MKVLELFKSACCDGLLVEVVDISSVKIKGNSVQPDCHENRQREKIASQIAVERMFNRCVEIKHADDGHPYIYDTEGSLSISHSRNVLIAVYSPTRVIGVDVEYPREALRRVASKFLNDSEQEYAANLDTLLRAWTIKEAVYKAMLHKGLSLFAIKLPKLNEKEPHAVVETNEGHISFRLYFDKIDEAIVTLAVRDDAKCRDKDSSLLPD